MGRPVRRDGSRAVEGTLCVQDRRSPADDRQRDPRDGTRAEVSRWLSFRRGHRAPLDAGGLRAADTGLANDQHTLAGKKLGRGLDHFRSDGALLVPPPTEPDAYED